MACCGGRRSSVAPKPSAQPASTERMAGIEGFVEIEYVGDRQLSTFTGEATNTRYRFGATRRIGFVDKRDVGERPSEGRPGSGFLALRRNGQYLFRAVEAPPAPAEPEPEPEPEAAVSEPEVMALDPNELTVDEIRALDLSPVAWAQLLDAERAGKNRKSAVEHIQAQLGKAE